MQIAKLMLGDGRLASFPFPHLLALCHFFKQIFYALTVAMYTSFMQYPFSFFKEKKRDIRYFWQIYTFYNWKLKIEAILKFQQNIL